MKRKICVVTGSRAEYGLLYWLLKRIKSEKELSLQLIVTGMHLSEEFGMTFKEIEKEFEIDKKINIQLSSDTSAGVLNSMSLAQTLFLKTFNKLKPHIVVVLGDRYEIFSVVIAAMISKIPIAHISGGETTEGAMDEAMRHCITKMSHIHFTALKEYTNRVIQLGEDPKRVFNVGSLGVENIKKFELLTKEEIEKAINFKFNLKNILVTFHSVTLENNTSKKQFQELLDALDEMKNTNIIFTKTNSDINGRVINSMIEDYVSKNLHKSIVITSMGQKNYLSTLQYVDAVVGNSSSGIVEVPSFKIATINIGDRQKGRIKAKSVLDCLPKKEDIKKSLNKIYSKKFKKLLKFVKNPYDRGTPSKKIVKVLKNVYLKDIIKKKFYNLKF